MDFKQQVEKTINQVARKANEVKEISKIKYSVYDLNSDIKKLYTEIGQLVYDELKGSSALTEDIQIKCDIVEAKLAKIKALKAKENQVKNNKGEINCPVCGYACPSHTSVCSRCGADLVSEVEPEFSAYENNSEDEL